MKTRYNMRDFYWNKLREWNLIVWRSSSKTYWGLEYREIVKIESDRTAYIRKPWTKWAWRLAEVSKNTAIF